MDSAMTHGARATSRRPSFGGTREILAGLVNGNVRGGSEAQDMEQISDVDVITPGRQE
jgi:hypothetical protein